MADPWYCTREDVKSSPDIALTIQNNTLIDQSIGSASRDIEGLCKRRFFPKDETKYFDYPNFQRSYPWKIYLDANELADVTENVPVLTSGGNVIPAADLLWGPWNYAPPFTRVEINRSTSASFGQGNTPQKDVGITGTFGYWVKRDVRGTLSASINGTVTSLVCSNGGPSGCGVGSILLIDSERMLVTEKSVTDSTATLVSGCTTAENNDVLLTVSSGKGSTFNLGEMLSLGAERMTVQSISGDVLTVERAVDGSLLSAHSVSDVIYVYRLLTVTRGDLGTTAASHTSTTSINVYQIPDLVRELAIAKALTSVAQKTSGYSRETGPEGSGTIVGVGMADLSKRVLQRYGRKARSRVV